MCNSNKNGVASGQNYSFLPDWSSSNGARNLNEQLSLGGVLLSLAAPAQLLGPRGKDFGLWLFKTFTLMYLKKKSVTHFKKNNNYKHRNK